MKLSTNNFLKGKVKDINNEFVDSSMYVEAKNLAAEFEGNDGSLVPFKGVERFTWDPDWRTSDNNISTGWEVVAAKYVETLNKVFYFMCAEPSNDAPLPGEYRDEHHILSIDTAGTIVHIMSGYDLGFVKGYEYHIDYVINNDRDFLFWVDNGKTAPKYIDIAVARDEFTVLAKGGNPAPDTDLETFINVCKKAPVAAPIIEYITDDAYYGNNLINKFFKFKYRYNYEDGSVSAFSPESKIDAQSNGFQTGDQYYTQPYLQYNNTIRVDFIGLGGTVSIDVAWQENDLSTWTYENIPLGGTFTFKNDEIGLALGETALDTKYYDNVPLKALSQTYIEQLMAYGGYTDGYDNVVMSTFSQIDYHQRWSIATRISDSYVDTTAAIFWTELNLANINSLVPVGVYFVCNVSVTFDLGNIANLQFQIKRELTDATEFMDQVRDYIENKSLFYLGQTVPGDYTVETELDAANNNDLKVMFKLNDVQMQNVTWSVDGQKMSFGIKTVQPPSLKTGEDANVGVVYYDQFNRQGAVNVIKETPHVLETWQQGHNNIKVTAAGLKVSIKNLAPPWAVAYQFVYSNGNVPKSIMDFQAITWTEIPAENSWSILVSNPYLDNVYAESLFADNSVLMYKYRFSTINSTEQIYPSDMKSVPTKKVYLDGSGNLLIDISSASYLYLASALGHGSLLEDATFQLRTQEKDSNFSYKEIGERFDINTSTQRHNGNVQNQVANDTVIGTITAANLTNIAGTVGLFRTTVINPTLWAVPVGTAITVENVNTTEVVQCYVIAHSVGANTTIESETVLDDTYDHEFIQKNYASSILDVGTVYIAEMFGQGAVSLDTYDFWGFNLYSAIESYSPIPIMQTVTPGDEAALKRDVIANNLGRIQIESKYFKETYRFNSLIGSQIMQSDTNFFGLTSFPNTAFSFKDLDAQYGNITALMSRDTDIVVFQETRCGRVLVLKDVLTTAQGNQSVTVSDKVFGQYVPYMGDTGIGKTFQSLQYYKGRIYFKALGGDVYRLSTDGLTELSELGLKDYFNKTAITPSYSSIMPDRDEYILQTEAENAEVYSINRKHWCPSLEIGPQKMSRLEDELVSFTGVFAFIHERTTNYSEMFTTGGALVSKWPSVSISANDQKTLTKIYETLEFAGENLSPLVVESINTKDATSADAEVEPLDSSWVTELGNGVYTDTVGAEYVGLGICNTILTVVGSTLVFDNPINRSAFQEGDVLGVWYNNDITTFGAVSNVTDNTLSTSGPVDVQYIGSQFFIVKNANIEGSDLRGLYLKLTAKMYNNSFFRINTISTFGGYDEGHEK